MEQMMSDFVKNASTVQKGLFLMAVGVSFVFAVQLVFYLVVKLWPRTKH